MILPFNRGFDDQVATRPEEPALTIGSGTWSYRELRDLAEAAASALSQRGVTEGEMVALLLGNSIDAVAALLAVWRLGAVPLPLPESAPRSELEAICAVAEVSTVVDRPLLLDDCRPYDGPVVMSRHLNALASGGSTGLPKVIVCPRPAEVDLDRDHFGHELGTTMVIPGPLFHSGPFNHLFQGLARGRHVVLMPRFDAEQCLRLVTRYQAFFLLLVPTMMHRIMRLPEEVRAACDVSGIRRVWHTGAVCPVELKQRWIDWVGPEAVWEIFGGTEGVATTQISGTEWLQHRGSVGRTMSGEIAIFDDDGNPVPAGTVGEIFMRRSPGSAELTYAGDNGGRRRIRGWESFGDLGYLDEDGYLFLADRRRDLIVTGGENVYPAEVEAALESHPAVVDCAVFGVADDDLGEQVCAAVCVDREATEQALAEFLAGRLARYKVPRRIVLSETPVRNEAGKVRRSLLRELVK